jgi:hypothetical protein
MKLLKIAKMTAGLAATYVVVGIGYEVYEFNNSYNMDRKYGPAFNRERDILRVKSLINGDEIRKAINSKR